MAFELQPRYFVPFDRTYADVTAAIEAAAAKLRSPDADWLRRLIASFQHERDLWNQRADLEPYRERWMQLDSKLSRLAAGAYLHIGYDLPRALADDWPGINNWAGGPREAEGETIYFRLRHIFPDQLARSARSRKTVGLLAWIFQWAPRGALNAMGIWVDALRRGAWQHGRILSRSSNRSYIESKMAEAMAAALEDASIYRPWSFFEMRSPDSAFYSPTIASVGALVTAIAPVLSHLSAGILGAYTIAKWIEWNWRLRSEINFIRLWGYLTTDYLEAAVSEPEGFAAHRERRRSELGLRAFRPLA